MEEESCILGRHKLHKLLSHVLRGEPVIINYEKHIMQENRFKHSGKCYIGYFRCDWVVFKHSSSYWIENSEKCSRYW